MKKSTAVIFLVNVILLVAMLSNPSLAVNQSHNDFTSIKNVLSSNKPIEKPIINTDTTNLTILHINDLHGWLEPRDGYGGVATYMGYFKQEGYSSDNDSFILLSGGDQNTGPAVATLSKGEAVIDVMNTMNFSAACIGNHEFDFGVEWMEKRKELADFPILSCNIYDNGTTDLANFTVPFVVQSHGGINVGIIGLTTTSTYTSAHPKITQDYNFEDYETAIRRFHDDVILAGADVVIVLAHVPPADLEDLADAVDDLDIDVFLGGHAGTPQVTHVDDSIVAMADHKSKQYAKIILTVDSLTKDVIFKEGTLVDNIEGGVTPDSEVQQVVDYWVNLVNPTEVITTASENIYDTNPESAIGNLVTDGFRYFYNWIDFGITHRGGGFRDYFRSGNITLADIVSVIPFENNLLEFLATGAQILEMIENHHGFYVYSGIRYNFSYDPSFHITSAKIQEAGSGQFVDIESTTLYSGAITDYTWWVNHKEDFATVDAGIHYRDIVIDYFRTLGDIALHTLDGRIAEVDEPNVPELIPKQFIQLVISTIFISMVYCQKKAKARKDLQSPKTQ